MASGVGEKLTQTDLPPLVLAFLGGAVTAAVYYRHHIKESRLDATTHLLNKAAFAQEVEKKTKNRRRQDDTSRVHGLLFADLDNLKQLNEILDHKGADKKILRPVADIIAHNLRDGDLAGRWGGDEYVIFLQNADTNGMERYCERIQREINTIVPDATIGPLGVTIAGTVLRQGQDYDNTISLLSKHLIEAKGSAGKNQVTFIPAA